MQKRVLAINDISCVGRCSLTVALPIISASGVECSILPTSILSNHTAFPNYSFLDLTEEMSLIADKWEKLGRKYDYVYTGFLGSKEQIDVVGDIALKFKGDGKILVDPAMADNGLMYKIFDLSFAEKMKELCMKADIICPNITEACFLTGIPYQEGPYTEEYINLLIEKLKELGINTVPFSSRTAIAKLKSFNKDDIVIFTAHGHPENYNQVLEERGIIYFDTTCVNVKENMRLIKENLDRGVIYIGKKDHEETIASLSLGKQVVLYDIKEKLDYNKVNFDNPLVINQTTLSILELKEIHKEIKKNIPNSELSNEVCGATRIRQEQIKDIDDSYDLIVIVGSSNSSNTTKLYQTAKEYHKNKKVLQINDVIDFEKEDISNYNNVIMLSGTSAPMEIIIKIKDYLERN